MGFHHYFHGKLIKHDLDKISSTRPIIIIIDLFHEFIFKYSSNEAIEINKEAFNLHEENNNLANFDDGHFSERGAIIVLPKLMQVLASANSVN